MSAVITEPDGEQRDLSSRKSLRQDRQDRIAREVQEEDDLLWVCSELRGRRLVWRLLKEANPFADPLRATPELTYTVLGEQRWGRKVMVMFQRSPQLRSAWATMQSEAEDHGW